MPTASHSIPQLENKIAASKNCGAIRCVAKTVKRCEPCYLAGSNMSFGRLIEPVTTALLPPVSKTTITLWIAQGRASLPKGSTICRQKSSVSKCFKAHSPSLSSHAQPPCRCIYCRALSPADCTCVNSFWRDLSERPLRQT